jgi:polyhydroxyalkanoate synthesis regulator phasin
MRLSVALKEKLYDIRLRDKLIAEGKISQAELKEFYDSLDDCTDKFVYAEAQSEAKEETSPEEA